MDSENNQFEKSFTRLLGLGIQTYTQLAQILDIRPSSIHKAKRNKRFPKNWISKLSEIYDKSPEWIKGELEEAPQDLMNSNLVNTLLKDMSAIRAELSCLRERIEILEPHARVVLKKSS